VTFQWECVFYLLRGKRTLHFFTWTHVIYWNSFCHCPSWICGIISCSSWPFNFLPSPWRFPTHQKLTCSLGFEQIDTFKKPGLTPKFLIELAIKLTVGTPFEMKMINYKVFWIFLLYMSYIVLPYITIRFSRNNPFLYVFVVSPCLPAGPTASKVRSLSSVL
jgi:hypothetical protein